MKEIKIFMVTMMVIVIAALGCICYWQQRTMEVLKTRNNTLSTYWREAIDERNELQRKNTEYEETIDYAAVYFDKYTTDRYSKQAMNLASHNPNANIGYVLIFMDGNVKVGAVKDMDELESIVCSYPDGSILTGNYWYV